MIGVDFGGTRIKAGRVEHGKVVRHDAVSTPADAGPGTVLDAVAQLVRRLEPRPRAVGVAIPGEVDGDGICYRLPNVPGFEGVRIAAELGKRLDAEVVVENDATTAALGELVYGHGRAHRSFLLATLGTGVGGGLVIDGRIRRGARGFAAEIGHILVDSSQSAWPCGCGRRGCMESIAGTAGLLRRFRELGGDDVHDVRPIAESARRGEKAGIETFQAMGRALGIGLAQAQKLADLDALVFSGGVSKSFDLVQTALRDALREHVFGAPTAEVPLLVSELGAHSGIIGAAELPGAGLGARS
jgi:glucokinase